jgi:hypothetical protein
VRETLEPTVLRMELTWLPRKMRAMIATIAMRARMSAYSASPWPSSSRRSEARKLVIRAIDGPPCWMNAVARDRGPTTRKTSLPARGAAM